MQMHACVGTSALCVTIRKQRWQCQIRGVSALALAVLNHSKNNNRDQGNAMGRNLRTF